MSNAKISNNPVGTLHKLLHIAAGREEITVYKVISITGNDGHVPSGEQLIFLRIVQKVSYPADVFVSLPLDAFVIHFIPNTPEDKFWIKEKKIK